jgi:hypothetical protein
MPLSRTAGLFLAQEARALRSRLDTMKPFALTETMVPAAAFSPQAGAAIETLLAAERRKLRSLIHVFLRWLEGPSGRATAPKEAHRRFTLLRLKFNAMLTQFDIFADALTQRSENETGVWLAGLDALAADALTLSTEYFPVPPVVCFLDRGIGAAIRRVKTRLPGGAMSPASVIRLPRERMVGYAIAGSLCHECGHEALVFLDLVASLRPALRERQQKDGEGKTAWMLFERWLKEILSDFWSVARVGIGSTLGLMGVVSLPRPFVFRCNLDDPHPVPWLRVKISAAIGNALYPHPQWQALEKMWTGFYPIEGLDARTRGIIQDVEERIPALVELLANHRPPSLRGASLAEIMDCEEKQPELLLQRYHAWKREPSRVLAERPVMVFAVVGQAKAQGLLSAETESRLLTGMLAEWAMRREPTQGPQLRSGDPSMIHRESNWLLTTPAIWRSE